jgi:hypothetical protein
LSVPSVPPRLVGPVVVVDEPEAPVVAETPEPPAQRPPRPRAGRSSNGDPEPAETSPKPEPATPPAPPAAEAALLRTPATADDAEAVKRVKEMLRRAHENLGKVNRRALSSPAQAQHETAARFIVQAEKALETRNLNFATYLAEKAETISVSLMKR